MRVLAIRVDKPEAELYLYSNGQLLSKVKWQAHLKLAETLNAKIEEILNKSSISYEDLTGIAVFKGPGSFTGLRIGMSVANALSYTLNVPVIAAAGNDWIASGLKQIESGKSDGIAIPKYGSAVYTTKPK